MGQARPGKGLRRGLRRVRPEGASQGQTWKKEIQLDIPFLKVILLIMARPIRIVYEGAVYHITIRGNERRPIFKNDEDRSYFIAKLAESVQRYDVRLYLCVRSQFQRSLFWQ